ncbi:TetR/AcrR family transcriptional regulator [Saccharopolyspora erythraea]|uniref:TetR/AcrR family transcriptional regulator n=1 Tax=Saccharopolyspora erythraea TaxID=1836 RepID=UPI0020123189|nr:TetR family transcriptional regulator [Saccharopolyspora erythraea]
MTSRRVPQHRTRRRPTRRGQVLSEELIVDTALRLIELHGADGLSMRRLGAALGADATAVYRYFDGKHQLVLAIADELIGRTFADFHPSGDWVADLRTAAELIYRTNRAHPRAAMLVTSRVTGRRHEVAAIETMLGILRGAGFAPADAVRHYHCFIDLVLAFSALDSTIHAGDPEQQRAEAATWHDVYRELPAEHFPNIAAGADELGVQMRSTPFHTTLELLLSAIAAQLPAPA